MKISNLLKNKDINIEKKYYILSNILNISIPEIKLNKEQNLTLKQYLKYKQTLRKVTQGLPMQYALKKAFFYDNEFYVNKNVLIPRFETEILVKEADCLIRKYFKNPKIIDIGTGSGIIAITLKKLDNNRDITATDISKKALKVAKHNSKKLNANINYIHTNLYDGINDKFDILISNPPYIDYNDTNIEEQVKKYEPHLALFAKDNGTEFYDKILKNSKKILKEKNIILFEIGYNQKELLTQIVKNYYPDSKILTKKDDNNFDRVMIISNNIE